MAAEEEIKQFNVGMITELPMIDDREYLQEEKDQLERIRESQLTISVCTCDDIATTEYTLHCFAHFGVRIPRVGLRRHLVRWIKSHSVYIRQLVANYVDESQEIAEQLTKGMRDNKKLNWVQVFLLARSLGIRAGFLFRDRVIYVRKPENDVYDQQVIFIVCSEDTLLPCEPRSSRDSEMYELRWYQPEDWQFGLTEIKIEKREREEDVLDITTASGLVRARGGTESEPIELGIDEPDTIEGSEREVSEPRSVQRSEQSVTSSKGPSEQALRTLGGMGFSEEEIREMEIDDLRAEVELIKAKARKQVNEHKVTNALECTKLREENDQLRQYARELKKDNDRLRLCVQNVITVADKGLEREQPAQTTLIISLLPQTGTRDPTHGQEKKGSKRKRAQLQCWYCTEGFDDLGKRREHLISQHAEENVFPCTECEAHYKNRISLNKHINAWHGATESREFRCESEGCNKTFRSRQGLHDHEGVHGDEFLCPWCEEEERRPFANNRTLKRHCLDKHSDMCKEETFLQDLATKRVATENVQEGEEEAE